MTAHEFARLLLTGPDNDLIITTEFGNFKVNGATEMTIHDITHPEYRSYLDSAFFTDYEDSFASVMSWRRAMPTTMALRVECIDDRANRVGDSV